MMVVLVYLKLLNMCYNIISKIMANRLWDILPNLIGREQCGFIAGRSPLDNILAVPEDAHSIENDSKYPPRMLIKINIEKAYDTFLKITEMSWRC